MTLPSFLRARSLDPLWLFTTNYDTVLEHALASAQEPFHVLYYMLDEGRFAHTAPNGTSRMIERPDAIRELLPAATVVVKLNGGITSAPGPTEQAVVAAGQFERVAASIPDGLPACMQEVLADRSMLFLGHGLDEPDVRRLIAEFARQPPSGWWAVRQPLNTPRSRGTTEHFSLQGLTTIEADLGEFTVGLREALVAC